MNKDYLIKTAQALVTEQRGILASDESTGTIKKRFDAINLESTPENHRRYRELLYTTTGIEEYIGGVIMFDETIRQSDSNGKPFVELLRDKGIFTGIKLDLGKSELANFPGEDVTNGLDGLRERIAEYKALGARFAKWRAVYKISDSTPSGTLISSNSEVLARYATLCQEQEIVPIVEPEVLMDGNHSIEKCEEVTTVVLQNMFAKLTQHKAVLEGVILKANMVLPGKDSSEQKDAKTVALYTVRTMRKAVPVSVPSIVFLSGGQTPQEATEHLDAINEYVSTPPQAGHAGGQAWELNFSYGRALQQPVLDAWRGSDDKKEQAQAVFHFRAKLNSLALRGEYKPEMENEFKFSE